MQKLMKEIWFFAWPRQWVISCCIGLILILRNECIQSVFTAADILRLLFLYDEDIRHIVYIKHKERKKKNVK